MRIASEDVNERLRFFYIVEAEAERSSALFLRLKDREDLEQREI